MGTRFELPSDVAHRGTSKEKADWSVRKHRFSCYWDRAIPALRRLNYGLPWCLCCGVEFSFATGIERVLWRAATLTALLSALGVASFVASCFHWHPMLRRKLRSRSTSSEEAGKEQPSITSGTAAIKKGRSRINTIAAYLKNNSVLKDPALDAPVEAILATWFLGFFYVSARAYIAVADFWALRSLPRSAYQDVSWSAFWAHI
ncbi:hypothetical protein GJ744_001422 [Endocarpon pusillum]|uniref:Uncharacterized protein n=1 Tax=Endocarpon pusillum TaxID=364733 RepID=A0A8H7E7V1_9EURO|nr:hypothetical protein GJ744_001422 [Endocarpon pusillum]